VAIQGWESQSGLLLESFRGKDSNRKVICGRGAVEVKGILGVNRKEVLKTLALDRENSEKTGNRT
jgi:hypothetical protein